MELTSEPDKASAGNPLAGIVCPSIADLAATMRTAAGCDTLEASKAITARVLGV